MLMAIYSMPTFTTKKAAVALAKPHGLELKKFDRHSDQILVTFQSKTREAIDGLSADLDYSPDRIDEI